LPSSSWTSTFDPFCRQAILFDPTAVSFRLRFIFWQLNKSFQHNLEKRVRVLTWIDIQVQDRCVCFFFLRRRKENNKHRIKKRFVVDDEEKDFFSFLVLQPIGSIVEFEDIYKPILFARKFEINFIFFTIVFFINKKEEKKTSMNHPNIRFVDIVEWKFIGYHTLFTFVFDAAIEPKRRSAT